MARNEQTAMPNSSTNLRNRVNKLALPRTRPLMPLFEVLSNSIHAINERMMKTDSRYPGKIRIKVIRFGRPEVMAELTDVESYQVESFEVIDNGIGLNGENYTSFQEFDSEYKLEIGGKGVGRLVCLKAFQAMLIESIYVDTDGERKLRSFEYKKTKEGFENYTEGAVGNEKKTGTKVVLYKYEEEYLKQVPRSIMEIGRQVVNHFQLYFIQRLQPAIVLENQNGAQVDLTRLYNTEFKKEILSADFMVNDSKFSVYISKSYNAKSNKILYCAHERAVKEEGLSQFISDLNVCFREGNDVSSFFFQVYIVGDFLNKNVNEERTGFNFLSEESEDEFDFQGITLAKIRKSSLSKIEELLSEFLLGLRKEKMDKYIPVIQEEFPNYSIVVNYNREKVEKLPAGLPKEELNLRLFEIESEWKMEVKKKGIEILSKKKDATSLSHYRELYEQYLTEFNEVGQSDLARYIVHRRSIIDLLDKLIDLNSEGKFESEEIIHNIFFPIKERMNTVEIDKQNLWLLDERLTFNSLLASDKQSKGVKELNSGSADRMDIVVQKAEIYDRATLFSESKIPFESFTIVEFKKPNRDDYKHGDEQRDPVAQVRKYVRDTIDGKIKLRGRTIEAKANTPFYCYIIADITPTLQYILEEESFTPTPDGMGYFRFYDTTKSKAYIEVLPFKKVIRDAKQRNKILFDKLNLID
jgi:Histidine kinase-, DNA gyrase B-, and HSP90-like ATPase